VPSLAVIENHIVGDVFTLPMWQEIQSDINYMVQAGADLASAATIVITNEFHKVTGVTTIDNINHAAPIAGQTAELWFTGAGLTIRNNGAGTGNIRTKTGADRTVSTNEIVAFIYDGAVWREFGPGGPTGGTLTNYFDLKQSTSGSTTTGTWFVPSWDTELADTGNFHAASDNFVTLTAGFWIFGGQAEFASNATGRRYGQILVNGSVAYSAETKPAVSGDVTSVSIMGFASIGAGGTVQARWYQDSGGTLAINSLNYWSPRFWGFKIA
jgi:hypothetical protein